MKNSKALPRSQASSLNLRLWEFTGTALVNLFACILLLVCLSPLSYMILTSFESRFQLQDSLAPVWPATPITYDYQGKQVRVYEVPTQDGVRELALVNPHLKYSEFIDPAHPAAGLVCWDGYWRSLVSAYRPEI